MPSVPQISFSSSKRSLDHTTREISRGPAWDSTPLGGIHYQISSILVNQIRSPRHGTAWRDRCMHSNTCGGGGGLIISLSDSQPD